MVEGLDPADRALVMDDYHFGCSSLMATLELKFSVYDKLPYKLLGAADNRIADARLAAAECLRMYDAAEIAGAEQHPLSTHLLQAWRPVEHIRNQ